MNQDELLERMWLEIIDAVDADLELKGAPSAARGDARLLARQVRYETSFAWCDAFDEAGHRVSWWLSRPETHACWSELAAWTAEAAGRAPRIQPKAPFADADAAWARLLEQGVTGADLAAFMTTQGREALAALRKILAEQKWRTGELEGLHESLLSADPSGLEGAPGSWPRPPPERAPRRASPSAGPAPLRTVKTAHALAFSPDGAKVVAAKGGAVTEIESGKGLAKCALLANTSHIAWSPDGRWIAGISTSGDIALCEAETGKRVRVLRQASEGAAPRFDREGALVSASWTGEVSRWDVTRGTRIGGMGFSDAMVTVVVPLADGRVAVLASHLPKPNPVALVFFDAELREQLAAVALPEWTQDVALDPSGRRALVTGFKGAAWLDLKTGVLSQQLEVEDPDYIQAGAISGDGRWVVLTMRSGFRLSPADDLAQGVTRALQFPSGRAEFSPDSERVALSTWKSGEVWEIASLARACAPRMSVSSSVAKPLRTPHT